MSSKQKRWREQPSHYQNQMEPERTKLKQDINKTLWNTHGKGTESSFKQ